jgi:hypothetical protein
MRNEVQGQGWVSRGPFRAAYPNRHIGGLDNDDPMQMIRHDDIRPQFHLRKMVGDGAPMIVCNLPYC